MSDQTFVAKVGRRIANRDSILGLVLFFLSAILMFGIIPWQVVDPKIPGTFIAPDFFPKALAGVLLLLSALLVYHGQSTSADSDRSDDKRITSATLICMAVILASIWAIPLVGMLPSACLAMILLMRLFGYRDWLRSIFISAGFVFLMFLFFEKTASVSIPRGSLFSGLF